MNRVAPTVPSRTKRKPLASEVQRAVLRDAYALVLADLSKLHRSVEGRRQELYARENRALLLSMLRIRLAVLP